MTAATKIVNLVIVILAAVVIAFIIGQVQAHHLCWQQWQKAKPT